MLGVGSHTTACIPGTTTPLPVPMVMVYADREIKAGKEVQFSWGEETWQRHQQIQVGDMLTTDGFSAVGQPIEQSW